MCSKSWQKGWQCALACCAGGLLAGGAVAQDFTLPEGQDGRVVEVLIPDQGLLNSPPVAPAAPVVETPVVTAPVETVAPAAPIEPPKPVAAKQKEDEGWVTVGKDDAREVQLDRGAVIDSDAGTKVAWVRINMLSDGDRDYAAIKAMNRFDCNTRSFITLKRVYLNARHHVLREESVKNEEPVHFTAGSMDERLWREVCEQPVSSEGGGAAALQDVAARVEQALAAAGARTSVGPGGSTIVRLGGEEDAKAKPPPPPASSARAGARVRASSSVGQAGGEQYGADDGRSAPLCRRGRLQAPIDIIERGPEHEADPIAFEYYPMPFRMSVSGRELHLTLAARENASTLFYGGKRYRLAQISLRMPGTRINARKMDVDVQMLHKADNGAALMLVVPLVATEYGESTVLGQILSALPSRIARAVTMPGSGELDVPSLIPFDGTYDRYQGSLPDAPCTENVAWLVMRSPMTMSREQLAQLRQKFPSRLGRPAQPANGRTVVTYR